MHEPFKYRVGVKSSYETEYVESHRSPETVMLYKSKPTHVSIFKKLNRRARGELSVHASVCLY